MTRSIQDLKANALTSIHDMFRQDQALRQELAEATKRRDEIKQQMWLLDDKNTTSLKGLIRELGWAPLLARGGSELWHLVQHADQDVDFQQTALRAFTDNQPCSITMWQCAFLEDRISMSLQRPQKYGSQLTKSKQTSRWEPYVLENPDRVDHFRALVGLDSLDEYVLQMNSK